MGNFEEKKVGVAVLYPTRYDNSKGTRIGPRYFLHQNYKANIKKRENMKETLMIMINKYIREYEEKKEQILKMLYSFLTFLILDIKKDPKKGLIYLVA